MKKYNIKFFYPNFFSNKLIAYVCLSLADNMSSSIFEVSVMGIASIKNARAPFYKDAIPPFLRGIAYRLFSNKVLVRFAEYRFKKTTNKNDIVYLWPGTTAKLFKDLKEKGCVVIRENINTHTAYAKKILDDEYRYLGFDGYENISNQMISNEMELQKYTDFVYSPSHMVTQSIQDYGVPLESILPTTYGLMKSEILSNTVRSFKDDDHVTFIFVGSICIRKGIHILLDAWSEANVHGRLMLVGSIDENVKYLVNNHLSDNVLHIPFVNDLKTIYADADIFILPSLEEGSPLVTYLALGAGLPSIVSPMGGGGIIDDTEGFVIEPHDEKAWIEAIKTLATNGELRKNMGISASKKSHEFTWENVAKIRMKQLEDKLREIH